MLLRNALRARMSQFPENMKYLFNYKSDLCNIFVKQKRKCKAARPQIVYKVVQHEREKSYDIMKHTKYKNLN